MVPSAFVKNDEACGHSDGWKSHSPWCSAVASGSLGGDAQLGHSSSSPRSATLAVGAESVGHTADSGRTPRFVASEQHSAGTKSGRLHQRNPDYSVAIDPG